jgi:hypothetical protein
LSAFLLFLFPPLLPFFLLNSLTFSFAVFDVLPHFSLTFYSLLSFFLSSVLPYFSPTCFCYWSPSFSRFRTIFWALLSNYFLLTILCGTFPWYWLIILPFCFPLLKECGIHISATSGK